MDGVRAKFYCQTEKTVVFNRPHAAEHGASREYIFGAVYDDGTPENQRYAKASPSGSLTIVVDNPAVTFEPGKSYYLDFTEVD
jgi:hypothetical protein